MPLGCPNTDITGNTAYSTNTGLWSFTVNTNGINCGNGKLVTLSCVNGAWSLGGNYVTGTVTVVTNTCTPFKVEFECNANITGLPPIQITFTPANSSWPVSP